jgi:hypothetical protein
MSVYEVTREKLGAFGCRHLPQVLYHLRHPPLGLEQVCEVTRGCAIVSSPVIDNIYQITPSDHGVSRDR